MSLKVAATVQDSVSQSVVSVHAALVSPGILLEMQISGLILELLNQNLGRWGQEPMC